MKGTITITAPFYLRRKVRRYLIKNFIEFKEDYGLLDSLFFVRYNKKIYERIKNDLL